MIASESFLQLPRPRKKNLSGILTLFHMTLGHIDPDYHESPCCYHIVRAKFTKIHDFVPFDICQDPVRLLLTFIFKKF